MGCTTSSNIIQSSTQHTQSQDVLHIDCETELPKDFDASQIAALLHEAIEKRREETILRIFYKYSRDNYEKLCEEFKTVYSIDIITLAFQNLSGTASEFLRLRIDSIPKSICYFIYYHLRDRPPNFQEKVLAILLGYHEINLVELADYYTEFNGGVTLQTHLKTAFEEEILEILLHKMNQNFEGANGPEAGEIASELHQATERGQLVSGEKVLQSILAKYPFPRIKDSFEHYLQSFQRDIVVEIEKVLPPSTYRDLLVLSTRLIQRSQQHFATLLNDLLKSSDEDSRKQYYLMFYIMTRNEIGLRDLKNAYQIHFFEPLQAEVVELVTDPVSRSAIIKAISHVPSHL